jgi:hypothetical protein
MTSTRLSIHQVVEILEGDEELVVTLCNEGLIAAHEEGFMPEEVARILVCRTLIRELDVDVSAIDIILRLRDELLQTRQQLSLVARELARLQSGD